MGWGVLVVFFATELDADLRIPPRGMYPTMRGACGGRGGREDCRRIHALIRKNQIYERRRVIQAFNLRSVQPCSRTKKEATMSAGGEDGGEINNLIHYLLCKAHQHCYTMATIALLIAFLSFPPGELKKKEGGKKRSPCSAMFSHPASTTRSRRKRRAGREWGETEVQSVFHQGQTTMQQSN